MDKSTGVWYFIMARGRHCGPIRTQNPSADKATYCTLAYHRVRGHEVSGNHTCYTVSSKIIFFSGPFVYFLGYKNTSTGVIKRKSIHPNRSNLSTFRNVHWIFRRVTSCLVDLSNLLTLPHTLCEMVVSLKVWEAMRTDNRTRPLRNSLDNLRGQKDSKHYLTQLLFVTESFVGVNIYQFI